MKPTPTNCYLVPPGWNALADIEYYTSRFGESHDYGTDAVNRIWFTYGDLQATLFDLICYFAHKRNFPAPRVNSDSKVSRMLNGLDRMVPKECADRAALTSVIAKGRSILENYEKIRSRHVWENSWLYELAQLADDIASVESDFKQRWFPGPKKEDTAN